MQQTRLRMREEEASKFRQRKESKQLESGFRSASPRLERFVTQVEGRERSQWHNGITFMILVMQNSCSAETLKIMLLRDDL